MPLSRSTQIKHLRANDAHVQQNAKPIAKAINRWLEKYAREMANRVEKELKTGKIKLKKAATDAEFQEELLQILMMFGLRQLNSSGARVASALDGEWLLRPGLVPEMLSTKTVRVQWIMKETEDEVRKSLRRIFEDAAEETPKPSMGKLARRIKNQFHGTGAGRPQREIKDPHLNILPTKIRRAGDGVLYTFSPERAALIARTESVQIENTAHMEGMISAGVEETEWIAQKDGKSGKRRHDLLNGKRVKIGELFFNKATGNHLKYPGDPAAPIGETANCRCNIVAVIQTKSRRKR